MVGKGKSLHERKKMGQQGDPKRSSDDGLT
jgi:hypothetical protein